MKTCFFPPRPGRLQAVRGGVRLLLVLATILATLLSAALPAGSIGRSDGARSVRPAAAGPLLASDIEASPSRSSRTYTTPRVSDLPGSALTLPESPPKPGGLTGAWRSIREWGITRRVVKVGSWVVGGVRVLWAIPKAIVKRDSRSLIEAISDLLTRAASETQPEPDQHRLAIEPPQNGDGGEPGDPDVRPQPALTR